VASLTPERFDELRRAWQPQFPTRQACAEAAQKYIETAIVPDERRFNEWMQTNLGKARMLAAANAELSDATSAASAENLPGLATLHGCYHCHGHGFVIMPFQGRRPESGETGFAEAKICPACRNTPESRVSHCAKCAAYEGALQPGRNLCWTCSTFEDELAGERCSNPRWHLPNANAPAQQPVPGWQSTADMLAERSESSEAGHEQFMNYWTSGLRERLGR